MSGRPVFRLVPTGRRAGSRAHVINRVYSIQIEAASDPDVSMSWSLLCPFHDDSFNARFLTVRSDGWFSCHACGVTGRAEVVGTPASPLDLAHRHITNLELENKHLREKLEPSEGPPSDEEIARGDHDAQ